MLLTLQELRGQYSSELLRNYFLKAMVKMETFYYTVALNYLSEKELVENREQGK